MARGRATAKTDPLVCFCNEVPRSRVEAAIASGASTLAEVFDATWAGCGPCGGSCQGELVELLRQGAQQRLSAPAEPSSSAGLSETVSTRTR